MSEMLFLRTLRNTFGDVFVRWKMRAEKQNAAAILSAPCASARRLSADGRKPLNCPCNTRPDAPGGRNSINFPQPAPRIQLVLPVFRPHHARSAAYILRAHASSPSPAGYRMVKLGVSIEQNSRQRQASAQAGQGRCLRIRHRRARREGLLTRTAMAGDSGPLP